MQISLLCMISDLQEATSRAAKDLRFPPGQALSVSGGDVRRQASNWRAACIAFPRPWMICAIVLTPTLTEWCCCGAPGN